MLMGGYTAVIVIHDVFLFCCSFVLFCVLVLQPLGCARTLLYTSDAGIKLSFPSTGRV